MGMMPNPENRPVSALIAKVVSLVYSSSFELSTWGSCWEVVILLHTDVKHHAEMRDLTFSTGLVFYVASFAWVCFVPAPLVTARPQSIPVFL